MKNQLIALGVVAAIVGVWQWGSDDAPATVTDGTQLALDRLWIDRFPTSERDVFHVFAAIDDDAVGIHQATSVWSGNYELFQFQAKAGTLLVTYPQTGETETVRLDARECKVADFEYCLEMGDSTRGVKRYFSKTEWVIKRGTSAPALAAKIDALLRP